MYFLFRLIIFYIYFVLLFLISFNNQNKDNNNLVIGLYYGFTKKKVLPFISSITKTIKHFDMVLFCERKGYNIIKEINNHHIIPIIITNIYPYYQYNDSKYPISSDILNKYIPYINNTYHFFFHNVRYHIINVWLNIYGKKYKKILFSDIRDVLIQKDIFKLDFKRSVYLGIEPTIGNNPWKIKTDITNRNWIKPYNPSIHVLNQRIINSGVIYGSNPEMTYFISDFANFLKNSKILTAEQGSLNYFYWTNEKSFKYNIIKCISHYSEIMTITLLPVRMKNCCYPTNNYLKNIDNTIPSIVHGYDRGIRKNNRKRRELYIKYIKERCGIKIV